MRQWQRWVPGALPGAPPEDLLEGLPEDSLEGRGKGFLAARLEAQPEAYLQDLLGAQPEGLRGVWWEALPEGQVEALLEAQPEGDPRLVLRGRRPDPHWAPLELLGRRVLDASCGDVIGLRYPTTAARLPFHRHSPGPTWYLL